MAYGQIGLIARRGVLSLILMMGLWTGAADAKSGLRVERLEVVTATGVKAFQVEIADNDATRERGMMFRTALAPDRGMLFDFKAVRPVAFWMRNTLIPLDILYIGPDGTIISIARNAQPHDETPIPSGGPVLAVLEIAGGRAAQIGVLPGDVVRHRIFKRG